MVQTTTKEQAQEDHHIKSSNEDEMTRVVSSISPITSDRSDQSINNESSSTSNSSSSTLSQVSITASLPVVLHGFSQKFRLAHKKTDLISRIVYELNVHSYLANPLAYEPSVSPTRHRYKQELATNDRMPDRVFDDDWQLIKFKEDQWDGLVDRVLQASGFADPGVKELPFIMICTRVDTYLKEHKFNDGEEHFQKVELAVESVPGKTFPIIKRWRVECQGVAPGETLLDTHLRYQLIDLEHPHKPPGQYASRRFKDWETLHNHLLQRHPYELVPVLPPKYLMPVLRHVGEQRAKQLEHFMNVLWWSGLQESEKEVLEKFTTDFDSQFIIPETMKVVEQITANSTSVLPVDVDLDGTGESLRLLGKSLDKVIQSLEQLKQMHVQSEKMVESIPYAGLKQRLNNPLIEKSLSKAVDDTELVRDAILAGRALVRRVQDACFDDTPVIHRQIDQLSRKIREGTTSLGSDVLAKLEKDLSLARQRQKDSKRRARLAKANMVSSMSNLQNLVQHVLFAQQH